MEYNVYLLCQTIMKGMLSILQHSFVMILYNKIDFDGRDLQICNYQAAVELKT